jgi:PAS domain S-box-containing protein
MPEESPDPDAEFLAREDSLRAVMENVQDMVAILTADARFVWESPSTERILGYSPAELTGRSALEMVHPADRRDAGSLLQSTVHTPLATGRLCYRIRHRDGSWRTMEAAGKNLLDDPRVRGIVLTARDVTDRVAAARELEVARATAEAASGAKSQFLSRMSHELRTPLNAILGFGQLLESDLERPDDRESAAQIVHAGRHLLRLIDEVLDISRIESGHLDLDREHVDAAVVADEAVRLVSTLARDAGVSLSRSADPRAGVVADPQRLRQILINLLSNAIKYNRPGGSVHLGIVRRAGRVRFRVVDTGRGISKDRMARLFVPFDRLGAEATGVPGTGLGLALSRWLAELMGGTLTARSREGRGATFRLELPIAPPGTGCTTAAHAAPTAIDAPAAAGTVLAVDDDPAGARLLERLLARMGSVRVLSAASGAEALSVIDRARVDLVILDLHLPDTNGLALLDAFRSRLHPAGLEAILITADVHGAAAAARTPGLSAVLTRPYDARDLVRLVSDLLRRRDPPSP